MTVPPATGAASAPPLISVALCTYNGARWLPEQLDSVLAQDWPNLEVVVVDDCSTDATWTLLEQAARRDARLRLHRNEHNLGFRANFERALSLARGAFIAPCDQDDIWAPAKLRTLAAAIGSHGLAYCDSVLMEEDGRLLPMRISQRLTMVQGRDPTAFIFNNCVSGHALLVTRAVFERAQPFPAQQFHDWWLAFVAAATDGIVYVPEALVGYRQHPQAQTDMLGRRKSGRKRGRANRHADIPRRQQWFDAMARVQGVDQAFFAELAAAHAHWQRAWFTTRMTRALLRRTSLDLINPYGAKWRRKRALKYLIGLRTKQWVFPARYGPAPDRSDR